MNYGNIVFGLIGFSTSFFFCLPNLKKWHNQKTVTEKLRIICEALEEAEARAGRLQERHDRILSQICSYYLTSQELIDALGDARVDMKDALEVAVCLRKMQIMTISSFPYEVDASMLESKEPSESYGSYGMVRMEPQSCRTLKPLKTDFSSGLQSD
ncbi:hypothetical protein ACFE04_006192 [Oxalis oulophora]